MVLHGVFQQVRALLRSVCRQVWQSAKQYALPSLFAAVPAVAWRLGWSGAHARNCAHDHERLHKCAALEGAEACNAILHVTLLRVQSFASEHPAWPSADVPGAHLCLQQMQFDQAIGCNSPLLLAS
jgi:hypothetical protein